MCYVQIFIIEIIIFHIHIRSELKKINVRIFKITKRFCMKKEMKYLAGL